MATTTQIKAGYVQIEDGSILVQVPSETSRWGFCLADAFGEETQSWDGGFGVAGKWTLLADNDPRITDADRERLQWILDEANA